MPYLSLFLLILSVPLGVAGQNIGLGMVAALLLGRAVWLYFRNELKPLPREFRTPLVLSLLLLAVHLLAANLNPEYPQGWGGKFLGGYLAWALLPGLLVLTLPKLPRETWVQLMSWAAIIAFILGMVAVSQYLWGWRIQGTALVSDGYRARGLYSHPLTLAYVSLILYVLGLSLVMARPQWSRAWIWVIGAGLALLMSFSKTVLAVAFCLTGIWLLVKLRGRARLWTLGTLLAVLAVTAVTNNPVSRRFSHITKGIGVAGDRVDDRVIFWQVAWDMVQARPLLGHGPDLSTDYRKPYYAANGYGDFEKQYEAHNTFLQTLVTGGSVAFVLFLAWWGWYAIVGYRLLRHPVGYATLAVIVAFVIASLTQNSFQDSEVRFVLAAATGFLWLFLRDMGFRGASQESFDR